MPITPNFTKQDVHKAMQKHIMQLREQMIKQLAALGEMCVNHARSLPGPSGNHYKSIGLTSSLIKHYTDRTGNLRSSIGYAIYDGGSLVLNNFKEFKGKKIIKDGKETNGVDAADEAIEEFIAEYMGDKTILLVVVAGMKYSLALEAIGFDVLSSSKNLAEKEFPKIKKRLRNILLK